MRHVATRTCQRRRLRPQPVEAWGGFDALGHFEMHILFTRGQRLNGLRSTIPEQHPAKKPGGVVGPARIDRASIRVGIQFAHTARAAIAKA